MSKKEEDQKQEKKVIVYPTHLNISVRSYAEFGENPIEPQKLYPEKIVNGRRIIPVYSLRWERVMNLYNCGKLHPKSQKLVLAILKGEADLVKIKKGEEPAKEVGSIDPNKTYPAGDSVMLSQLDVAGANLAAQRNGDESANIIGAVLQNDEVDKLKEEN